VFRPWVVGEPGPLSLKRGSHKKAQKAQRGSRRKANKHNGMVGVPRDLEGHRILAGGETTGTDRKTMRLSQITQVAT